MSENTIIENRVQCLSIKLKIYLEQIKCGVSLKVNYPAKGRLTDIVVPSPGAD